MDNITSTFITSAKPEECFTIGFKVNSDGCLEMTFDKPLAQSARAFLDYLQTIEPNFKYKDKKC